MKNLNDLFVILTPAYITTLLPWEDYAHVYSCFMVYSNFNYLSDDCNYVVKKIGDRQWPLELH